MSAPLASAADLLRIDDALSDEERAGRARIRTFVDEHVRPSIADWYDRAVFPTELIPELARLGLFGMHLSDPGCAGESAVAYGIVMQELEAGDSAIRTLVSVQGSLAMSAISKWGSAAQKAELLPKMAAGEVIGCFGLTEPDAGSDPGSMTTRAVRDGGDWILRGAKRWIGLASIADIAIIWAKVEQEDGRDRVRGFIVPTSAPGFTATPIAPKLSMRASVQCDIDLDDVRLPGDAILPAAEGLRAPLACLDEARFGIVWGVLGAARDSIDTALTYTRGRVQFGRPVAATQLVQQKLAEMAIRLGTAQLLALHLGRQKDAGNVDTAMISVGKLENCRTAIDIARTARTLLGGNGVTTDLSPIRHAANLESVRTYEGTDEIHTLVVGERLTGLAAFR